MTWILFVSTSSGSPRSERLIYFKSSPNRCPKTRVSESVVEFKKIIWFHPSTSDSVKQVCVCWGGGWVDFLCDSEMKPLGEPLLIPSKGKDSARIQY